MDIYLVIEYESGIIYLPFKSIKDVDAFTVEYDNLLELAASIGDILELGIPKKEITDVYLSQGKDKVFDDMQEHAPNRRYLAVKYSNNDFVQDDIRKVFISYLGSNIGAKDKPYGLEQVIMNYCNKYNKGNNLSASDIEKIASLYLGDNYVRYKDFYFTYKDRGYKFKISRNEHVFMNTPLENQELKRLLEYTTGYTKAELIDYIFKELGKEHVK